MWLSLRLVNNEADFISANLPSLFALKQDRWVSQFLSVRSLIFKAISQNDSRFKDDKVSWYFHMFSEG